MKKINMRMYLILGLSLLLLGCSRLSTNSPINVKEKEVMKLHFIDVGQGDASLIEYGDFNILIDAGPKSSREKLINYLKENNIEKINYLLGTHPHEDHIGGLPEVIRNFSVDRVYLPKKISNTKIFEELLLEIKEKDIELIEAKKDMVIYESDGVKLEFLWPDKVYDNTNNNSVVSRISYDNFKILIMADAEKEVEKSLIETYGSGLKADILRLGHHGSSTSSIREFLDQVKPSYSIISVGQNNKYKHPSEELIRYLKSMDTNLFRTDLDGNLIFEIDEQGLINKNKASNSQTNNAEYLYVANKNTLIYHVKTCSLLPKEENRIFLKDSDIKVDYRPHSCIK